MKAVVGAFNQEKAFVGAFSVLVKTDGRFAALIPTLGIHITQVGQLCHHNIIFSIAASQLRKDWMEQVLNSAQRKLLGSKLARNIE